MNEKTKYAVIKWLLVIIIVAASAITVFIQEHRQSDVYSDGVYDSERGITKNELKGLYGKIMEELKND